MKTHTTGLFKKTLIIVVFASISLILSACLPQVGFGGTASDEGEFKKGAIVKKFPDNVPIYKNSKVIESWGNGADFGASFVVDRDLADVFEFYNKALPALGWQSEASQASETNYVFKIKNEQNSGSVIINTASDGKTTAISIDITHR